jgi:hypothetical protein
MFRFSLRTFLIVTVAIGMLAGWLGSKWAVKHKRRQAIYRIYACGGSIAFREGTLLERNSDISVLLTDVDTDWRVIEVRIGSTSTSGNDSDLSTLLGVPEVQCVHLLGNGFTDAGLERLSQLTELRWLWLNETSITITGLSRFARFRKLQHLTLIGIRDSGLENIDRLISLEHLQIISSNHFTDSGLAHLKSLSGIQTLDVFRTPINGEGLRYLVALPNLRVLRLNGTQVNNDTIRYVREIRNLECLNIADTLVDEHGLDSLRETMRSCEITYEKENGKVETIRPMQTRQARPVSPMP